MTEQDIMRKIEEHLRPIAINALELWSINDVAVFLRYDSIKTVQNHIISKPTFPVPHNIPSKRWRADEVRAWAKKQPRGKG